MSGNTDQQLVERSKAEPDSYERFVWGWLRLILGFVQMALVAFTFGLLITSGPTTLTILFALATTCITLLSKFIYRGQRRPTT